MSVKKQAAQPDQGHCFAIPLGRGRWGACQILGRTKTHLDVVTLDWSGHDPPTLPLLERAVPLELTHHSHEGRLQRTMIRGLPPAAFRSLGTMPLVMQPDEECRTWGGWGGLALGVRLQHWWDHVVPSHEKDRYKAAKRGEPKAITLGGTTKAPRRGTVTIGAFAGADFPLPADTRVDWNVLDELGDLTQIEYQGRDARVLEYIGSRVLLTKLSWYGHGQCLIDVERLGLRELRVDAAAALELRLPADLEKVAIGRLGAGTEICVAHPTDGAELRLDLWQPEGDQLPPPIPGLEALSAIEIARVKRLDLQALARYPKLESVSAWGTFAALENAGSLALLEELVGLSLYDFYDLDTESLPPKAELPQLYQARFAGLRQSDAKWLRKHWRGVPDLDIHGAKNDAWVKANAENPLRDWVDDDKTFGEKACKAYAKAYRLVAKQPAPDAIENALRSFVRELNKLDAKYEQIDTVRREQAADAFDELAKVAGIDRSVADAWFDEEREF